MKEYIERVSAIKRIKEYSLAAYDINLDNEKEFASSSLSENYCEGLYEATELIDNIPAAATAQSNMGNGYLIRGKFNIVQSAKSTAMMETRALLSARGVVFVWTRKNKDK